MARFGPASASAFDFLSWQEQLAANTDIKVQLATAPNNGGVPGAWSAWLGLNGAGTYYQDNQETLIPLVNGHNDAQFIRYRAVLTSDGANTPILDEIKINYTP